MLRIRPVLVATVVVASGALLAGCTAAEAEPEDTTSITGGVAVSGSAPIMFAFTCRTGTSDRTESYTTYSAVWADHRSECTAERTTGTEMSDQQADAVEAAGGDATLEELAAGCAVRDAGAWVESVSSDAAAHVAAGLIAYCPGHPERDRLREALAAYRG